MATFTSIFPVAASDGVTATLANGATATVTLSSKVLVAFNANGAVTITYGNAGKAPTTPSATVGFMLPANMVWTIDLGSEFDRFTIFNGTGGSITYSYQQMSRF